VSCFLDLSTSITLNDFAPQKKGFNKFFAIFSCSAKFKNELQQNGWRLVQSAYECFDIKLEGARQSAYLRHSQTDRQTHRTDRSTNLIISSNSLRSIGGDNENFSTLSLTPKFKEACADGCQNGQLSKSVFLPLLARLT